MFVEASGSGPDAASYDELNVKLQASALKVTRNAALLPIDISFHRSMDPTFANDLDAFSARTLALTNKLLSLAATVDPNGKGKGKLHDQDDVVDNFHSIVVDSVDQLLERTDMSLDEFLGRTKAPVVVVKPLLQKSAALKGKLEPVIQHAHHLAKPQLSFKTPVDNSDSPWHHSLKHKYNAQVPLEYTNDEDRMDDTPVEIKNHPYYYEIKHITYPPQMFRSSPPIPFKSFDGTPFTWVASTTDLDKMMKVLLSAKEIAVDLEHHSYRSYLGFLCLMQISTREQDWVVDLLALREELQVLNEVLTNPDIIKVFHGAESDIVWLQQDLNLYIVNLFDTFHASKLLEFPRHGLATLLEMYCDFIPDKRFQLADWRIRPLTEDMLFYARSDTHYLLFIYDSLRNALLDRAQSSDSLVREVLSRSEETSLRTFTREPYDFDMGSGSGGWDSLAKKWNKPMYYASSPLFDSNVFMSREVSRAIHRWRDMVAREEDESTRYIMGNQYIFQLAEQPPADMPALLRAFNTSVPAVIRRRGKELLEVIRDVVRTSLSTVSDRETMEVEEAREIIVSTPPVVSAQTSLPWNHIPKETSSIHKRVSSLFGASIGNSPSPESVGVVTTSSSSLFGITAVKPTPVASTFENVKSKIHSSLIIAPSALVPTLEPVARADAAAEAPEEIPYVPASQRQTIKDEDDTLKNDIIIAGQRPKKRKRGNHKVVSDEPNAKRKGEEIDEFDFSSAPRILDAKTASPGPPTTSSTHAKKGKKGGAFYGDFPAPPKAQSEMKSGNKSYTFK